MLTSPYAITPIAEEFVAPAQFFHRKATGCEKRLLLAVLEEALSCLYYHIPKGNGKRAAQRLRDEARAWIESDDTHWVFSFRNVCEALDYDVDTLRPKVLADGFRLQNQGFRAGEITYSTTKVGTKDYLEDIDRAQRRPRRRIR